MFCSFGWSLAVRGFEIPAMFSSDSSESSDYLELMATRRRDLVAQCTPIFAGRGPSVLEIGSGHGHFLTAYAGQYPDRLCVGIDLVGERIERALRKRDRAGLANLHFVRAELRFFLECVSAEARWREVYVLFPDPWPKVRHHKHRLIQDAAVELIARQAAPACRLYFRTDFLPYHEAATAVFARSPDWELITEAWPFESVTVFQSRAATHYSLVAKRRA